jgi:hypothetical protein
VRVRESIIAIIVDLRPAVSNLTGSQTQVLATIFPLALVAAVRDDRPVAGAKLSGVCFAAGAFFFAGAFFAALFRAHWSSANKKKRDTHVFLVGLTGSSESSSSSSISMTSSSSESV